jgi:hypothetical protein
LGSWGGGGGTPPGGQGSQQQPAARGKPLAKRPASPITKTSVNVLKKEKQVKQESTGSPTEEKKAATLTAVDSVDFILRAAERRAMRARRAGEKRGGGKTRPARHRVQAPNYNPFSPKTKAKVVPTAASFREKRALPTVSSAETEQKVSPTTTRNMSNLDDDSREENHARIRLLC